MEIKSSVEKDQNTGKNTILIQIDEDEAIILRDAIKSHDKFDEDNKKYKDKLNHLEEMTHKVWVETHPS